jgi:hypothetical protein
MPGSTIRRRKTHGEFAITWEAALEAHASAKAWDEAEEIAAIRTRARSLPPGCAEPVPPSFADGGAAEYMICGEQVKRVNGARWGKRAEALFFATLAETANVKLAADAAGFSTTALYARRLRHPVFAEKWAAAVATARARLDLGIVELANKAIEEALAGVSGAAPKISIAEALQILKIGAQPEVPTGPDGRRRLNAGARANLGVATNEEIAEALAKRLAAFGRRIEREKGAGKAPGNDAPEG